MADPRIYYVNEAGCKVWVIPNYLTSEQSEALHQEIKGMPLIQHYLGKMWSTEVEKFITVLEKSVS